MTILTVLNNTWPVLSFSTGHAVFSPLYRDAVYLRSAKSSHNFRGKIDAEADKDI